MAWLRIVVSISVIRCVVALREDVLTEQKEQRGYPGGSTALAVNSTRDSAPTEFAFHCPDGCYECCPRATLYSDTYTCLLKDPDVVPTECASATPPVKRNYVDDGYKVQREAHKKVYCKYAEEFLQSKFRTPSSYALLQGSGFQLSCSSYTICCQDLSTTTKAKMCIGSSSKASRLRHLFQREYVALSSSASKSIGSLRSPVEHDTFWHCPSRAWDDLYISQTEARTGACSSCGMLPVAKCAACDLITDNGGSKCVKPEGKLDRSTERCNNDCKPITDPKSRVQSCMAEYRASEEKCSDLFKVFIGGKCWEK